jgi:hypothetical protein
VNEVEKINCNKCLTSTRRASPTSLDWRGRGKKRKSVIDITIIMITPMPIKIAIAIHVRKFLVLAKKNTCRRVCPPPTPSTHSVGEL